ncbi:putative aldo-keto reductase [Filobasidium floriforme]|uniref:putative aldo-keto reductase n=1 Tax=Filobasidium floriforme TaxID=5210 RepID=UPI001E8EA169|nr:putative aldo-keto reductase [Filobasidium floriforme]KAH8082762.1 putative aldo-keto reductase [Filobasidium floriforme]
MSTTQSRIPTAKLGSNGPAIPRLGFGLMGLSAFYGGYESDEKRFEVLDRAIELGETFWDTSDIYGDNEDLLGKYFKHNPSARSKIFLATKFAGQFDGQTMTVDSSPEYAKKALEKSLQRLGLDSVDLYYVHRIDGKTPIEKTMEFLKEAQQQGKIKYIGLSEASARTLRRASKIVHIDAVQLEYSPFALECEADDDRYGVLKACRELGTAIVAYSPLGRGLLTGQFRSPDDFEDGDFRKYTPRFSKENFPKNLEIVDKIEQLAKKKNVTPGQLTLAWLLAQGDDIFPIPGTKKIKYLEENVGGADVKLSKEEVDEIRQVVEAAEVAGGRYPDGYEDGLYADTPEL